MSGHILLVEDDGDIRRGLVATLESEGYEVTAVANGAQAMGLLKQESYDLIMLDVMMPKLSGFDVCRELRALGIDNPVLFLTAKGEEVDKVVGLKLGADDYVTKPFGIHELLARVEALLRRAKPERSVAGKAVASLSDVLLIGTASVDWRNYTASRGGRRPSVDPSRNEGVGDPLPPSGRSGFPRRVAQRSVGCRLLWDYAHARSAYCAVTQKDRSTTGPADPYSDRAWRGVSPQKYLAAGGYFEAPTRCLPVPSARVSPPVGKPGRRARAERKPPSGRGNTSEADYRFRRRIFPATRCSR